MRREHHPLGSTGRRRAGVLAARGWRGAVALAALLGSLAAPPPSLAAAPGPGPAAAAGPAGPLPPRGQPLGRTARLESTVNARTRRSQYFQRAWGVDLVGVRPVASGYMLRLDYRVVDPAKAATLTDHNARAYLIDEATRTALAVPAMENVGELRQVGAPEPNRTYFMLFGNPGRLVKSGARVTIVVGTLRAEGVVVEEPSAAPRRQP